MTTAVAENKQNKVVEKKETPARRSVVPEYRIDRREEGYRIRLELPGVPQEGLDIQLKDGNLAVTGKASLPEFEGFKRAYTEFKSVHYAANFRISDDINGQAVTAALVNGVLTLDLPKREEVLPRTIKVNVS